MLAKSFIVFVTLVGLTLAGAPDITDENFNQRVHEFDNTLVMFYAPW